MQAQQAQHEGTETGSESPSSMSASEPESPQQLASVKEKLQEARDDVARRQVALQSAQHQQDDLQERLAMTQVLAAATGCRCSCEMLKAHWRRPTRVSVASPDEPNPATLHMQNVTRHDPGAGSLVTRGQRRQWCRLQGWVGHEEVGPCTCTHIHSLIDTRTQCLTIGDKPVMVQEG